MSVITVPHQLTQERDWLWLQFDQKPDPGVLDTVRRIGGRWSKKRRAWYFTHGHDEVKMFLGPVSEGEAPAPAERDEDLVKEVIREAAEIANKVFLEAYAKLLEKGAQYEVYEAEGLSNNPKPGGQRWQMLDLCSIGGLTLYRGNTRFVKALKKAGFLEMQISSWKWGVGLYLGGEIDKHQEYTPRAEGYRAAAEFIMARCEHLGAQVSCGVRVD